MAEAIVFDFVGRGADRLAGDFRKTGDSAALAARGARVMADSLDKQRKAALASTGATLTLAKADRLLAEAEDELSGKTGLAAEAERAHSRAMAVSGRQAKDQRGGFAALAGSVTGLGDAYGTADSKASMFRRALAGLNLATGIGEPMVAGLAVAAGGLAAAFTSAAAGAGVFGLVAGQVMSKVSDATKKAGTAQQSYESTVAAISFRYREQMAAATTNAQRQAAANTRETAMQAALAAKVKATTAAYAGLTPAQLSLAKATQQAKDQWDGFVARATPGVAAVMKQAFGVLPDVLKSMQPFLEPTEAALSVIIADVKSGLQSPYWRTFINYMAASAGPAMVNFAKAAGNIAHGLAGVLTAFGPLQQRMSSGLVDLTGKFAKWGETLGTHSGFQTMMTMAREYWPPVRQALGNLFIVLKNVLAAMAGIATPANSKALWEIANPMLALAVQLSSHPELVRTLLYILMIGKAAGPIRNAFDSMKTGWGTLSKVVGFLSGGKINLGMQGAGDTMLLASRNMQRAADTMAGASIKVSAAGAAGAAGGAAGKAAGAAAGVGILSRLFGGLKWAVKGGIAVAVAQFIVKPTLESIPQDQKQKTTFWDRPTGTGPKGSSGWESWTQLGRNLGILPKPGEQESETQRQLKNWDSLRVGTNLRLQGIGTDTATAMTSARGAMTAGMQGVADAARGKAALMASQVAVQTATMIRGTSVGMEDIRSTAQQKSGLMSQQVAGNFARQRAAAAGQMARLRGDTAAGFDGIAGTAAGKASLMRQQVAKHFALLRGDASWQIAGTRNTTAAGFETIRSTAYSRTLAMRQQVAKHFGLMRGDVASLGSAVRNLPSSKTITIRAVASGTGTVTAKIQAAQVSKLEHLTYWAAGGRIPGYGGGDTVPIMAERGEAVVDKDRTRRFAPLLGAMGVPGFAAGGVVGLGRRIPRPRDWMAGRAGEFARLANNEFLTATISDFMALARKEAQDLLAQSGYGYRPGAGVEQWRPLVLRALAMEGLSTAFASRVLYQMQTESGGNPRAINLWDVNAQRGDPSRGLLQVIGSTFRAYHWPGTSWDIYDALANIAAAVNYARHVYGPNLANQYGGMGSGRGYATGSWNVPSTGPAVIHKGEMVIPARTAAAIRASGGGSTTVVLENRGVIGSRFELEDWLATSLDNLRRKGKI